MRRRTLLTNAAALGTIATLAGCLDDTGGGDDTTTADPTTEATTTEPTTTEPTTTEPLEVTDQTIETGTTDCGEANDASVEFADDGATITGTITANTPCYDAVIDGVRVVGDVLDVTVTVQERDTDSCQECIGAIEYTATLTTNAPPQSVVVSHTSLGETTTVTDESR